MGEPTDVRGTSKASDREWAGSVERMIVRSPASAQRRAVAAAAVVFPTPPLPVKRRMRGRGDGAVTIRTRPVVELAQGRPHDLAFGPPFHEPRDGHDEID